ncbi:MAG TPA: hypothetical protein VLJ39_06995 [Tepidisphaeraceae bacterium]|jgi:hypothetical protein|nr:hypothetical protein [Tepidisphaeraceae bacterium]
MKTADLQADLREVCERIAHRQPIDPEVIARVQERASEVRAELGALGTTNLAADLIRQTRDE